MRKVLIAFDGLHYPESACEFAKKMNEQDRILLVGVFLPKVGFSILLPEISRHGAADYMLWDEKATEKMAENISKFEGFCTDHHIAFRVHQDVSDFALPELERESAFADLLVLSMEKYFEGVSRQNPNEYLQETLGHSRCPVVLVPENFASPREAILAYDGHESSVFALKQFVQLFPAYTDEKLTVVYAAKRGKLELPEQQLLSELASCHFQETKFLKLEIDPHVFFATWLSENKQSILISGGYGRSSLSRLFRHSFLDETIAEHSAPLFIAHR